MLSDEEKAKDILINFRKYNKYYKEEKALSITISFELKEALNEEILSYLQSGYKVTDDYVILCRKILEKLNLKEIYNFEKE